MKNTCGNCGKTYHHQVHLLKHLKSCCSDIFTITTLDNTEIKCENDIKVEQESDDDLVN